MTLASTGAITGTRKMIILAMTFNSNDNIYDVDTENDKFTTVAWTKTI